MSDETLCPFCGAYSTRSCEYREMLGACAWEDIDALRDDRDERRRLEREDRE
jgi:hypothetical protein